MHRTIVHVTCLGVVIMACTCMSASAALIGYWNFNEGSGSTAFDSSGNGYNGALNGNTNYVAGPPGNFSTSNFGTALNFDGASDYVEITSTVGSLGHPLSLVGTPYTIAFWLKYAGGNRFINKDDGNDVDGGYSVRTGDGTNLYISHLNNTGNHYNGTLNAFLGGGAWRHLAVTWDGTNIRGYSNGVLAFTTSSTILNLTDDAGDVDPLWFGGIPVHGQWLNGQLDDVRIYNNALSGAEVRALAIPEPTGLALVGLLGAMVLRRRR